MRRAQRVKTLEKELARLQERYWKAGFAEKMRIARRMQEISEELGLLQRAPIYRAHTLGRAALFGLLPATEAAQAAKAATTAEQVTAEMLQARLAQAGMKIRLELAENLAKSINAERAAAQAAKLEAEMAATQKEAAEAVAKAAKRSTWTKEASQQWQEIYRANIEQAARRTEAIERAAKIGAVIGGLTAAANVFTGASVIYNAYAGNLDSARLLQFNKGEQARMEAYNKLKQRELEMSEKRYQLELAKFLTQMGYYPSLHYAQRAISAMSYEQLYALEQARHYWTMQRGAMAAQAELAKIREASQWKDWERAREAARQERIEQLKGQIKQALQEGKYRWEEWLERLKSANEERQIVLKATYDAWKEYLDDLRDHAAKMTQLYMKAALEDELTKRATAYAITKETAKAQIEVAKKAELERLRYYWERKRDFVKAIRDHARITQIDATRLWELWRKELSRVKKAIERGEPYITAIGVPDSPIPVVLKVDPSRPGKLIIAYPDGKEVTL